MSDPNSTFEAILNNKCPRCYRGDLFYTSIYKVSKFHKMYKSCAVCDQTFEPEPGFYFGAMFVAYGMLVVMAISIWLILFFFFNPKFGVYITVILLMNVLLLPFIFRYSRTLFLFGFGGISFDKQYRKNKT